MNRILAVLILSILFSCGDNPIPKPSALLRLEYPVPTYEATSLPLPFNFERNLITENITEIEMPSDKSSAGFDLNYPTLKASVFFSYKGLQDNLDALLIDVQRMTQEHARKADGIIAVPFENREKSVYGMVYEIDGDAASQSQFYVTDSLNHFLTGSLYFYTKPNYDSILPAAHYIKKDIEHIMETIRWKN